MKQYLRHPIAVSLSLPVSPEQEESLRTSVRDHGVLHPATIFEEKILDGWARYLAAKANDIELPIVDYVGNFEPTALISYLLAVNIHRKHYSKLQRALLAARVLDTKRGTTKGGPQDFTTKDAATLFSVSASYVNLCTRAVQSHNTALIHDIETGSVTRDHIEEVLGRSTSHSAGKLAAVRPASIDSVADKLLRAIQDLKDDAERRSLAQAIYLRIKVFLGKPVPRDSNHDGDLSNAKHSATSDTPPSRRTRHVS